ncbi:MAG: DUF4132 domain-containing protein [Myxococcota bacterium]
MRFTLQAQVVDGIPLAPPSLRVLAERALAADDWAKLPLEARAVAAVLSKAEEVGPWLQALAVSAPLEALELALRMAHLTLRFALHRGALVRVLDVAAHQSSARLPPPAFWLTLRRSLDAQPLLRREAEQLADALAPEAFLARQPGARVDNLCLRAALAFLFPDAPARWRPEHRKEALALEDPVDVAFVLLALLRGLPQAAAATTWPPPVRALRGLPDAELEEVTELLRDEALLAQRRRRAELKRAELDVAPLLLAVSEPDALETLCQLAPTPALLEQALGLAPATDAVDRTLRDSVVHGWARELEPSSGSLTLALPEPIARAEVPLPPPLPLPEPERPPGRLRGELAELWNAVRAREEVYPEELEALLPLGPLILPKVREWARREPSLLAVTGDWEDVGLDEALMLAWNGRRRPLALAAREFARRHPERAAIAAARLCFSPVEKERELGRVALRALERSAARFVASLDAAHRQWLEQLLSRRAEVPSRLPKLPAFVRLAALPPVVSRGGDEELTPESLELLVRVMKATPADDGAALLALTAGLSPESLGALAGSLFRQWLGAGAPPKEKWALLSLGHFPSDPWARVVGELCVRWAQSGFPARAQDAVAVLGRMGSREALAQVHHVATKVRTAGLRARAREAFDEAAARLGLTAAELEDRLFPDVSVPAGASVVLDGVKAVVMKEGRALKPTEELKRANKQLKAAFARLERVMCEGPGLGALHFTETWGMHPVLRVVAERVVWGLFDGERRVGLFVPASPPRGDALPPDAEGLVVRPVHPLELSAAERARVSGWVVAPQPFEQLERECFEPARLAVFLGGLREREVPVTAVLRLERFGWERERAHDGGLVTQLVRRGDGFSATLTFEPGIYAGDPLLNDEQLVLDVELEGSRPLTPRMASELQRELSSLT